MVVCILKQRTSILGKLFRFGKKGNNILIFVFKRVTVFWKKLTGNPHSCILDILKIILLQRFFYKWLTVFYKYACEVAGCPE